MNSEETLAEAKAVIQEWIDKQGHERCWYYPNLFTKLVELFEITPTKKTFPSADFRI
ncbi:MAG: hypothetical protein Q7K43_03035 [Candidatus Woesearchaeota archaeon]|nr:hypothetical protein [Candidatus Woesearchaeota archaeon]